MAARPDADTAAVCGTWVGGGGRGEGEEEGGGELGYGAIRLFMESVT